MHAIKSILIKKNISKQDETKQQSTSLDKFELIDKAQMIILPVLAFMIILPVLSKYIGRILLKRDENNWWKKYVLDKLRETRDLPQNGSKEEYINKLDISACLNIIIQNWDEIFKHEMDIHSRELAYSLLGIRNKEGAHYTTEILSKYSYEDVDYALRQIIHFMRPIDLDIANKISEMQKDFEDKYKNIQDIVDNEEDNIIPPVISTNGPDTTEGESDEKKPDENGKENTIITLSWQDFVEKVSNERYFPRRIEVIKIVTSLFNRYKTFAEMNVDERKFIAGIPNKLNINGADWALFGSMKGAGKFKHKIIQNDNNISLALAQIPLAGEIKKENYISFWEYYRIPFSETCIATATRLLAMKRPDTFICLDSPNKNNLCDSFGIRKSNIDKDFYWDEIILRIFSCIWWNSPKPNNEDECIIHNARAALLDSLIYDE